MVLEEEEGKRSIIEIGYLMNYICVNVSYCSKNG